MNERLVVQWVRASLPGVCCDVRPEFEARFELASISYPHRPGAQGDRHNTVKRPTEKKYRHMSLLITLKQLPN